MWLALTAGMLISGGILLFTYGLVTPGQDYSTQLSTGVWKTRVDSHWRSLVLGIGVGIVGGWWLGQPVAGIALGAIVALLPWLLSAPKNVDVAICESLESWIRQLIALLGTGISVAEAIRRSRASGELAEPVERLRRRMTGRIAMGEALGDFADDVGSPDVDAVAAALTLSADRGGTGARACLAGLADSVGQRLWGLRDVDAERSKPRAVVRQVTVLTAGMLALAIVVGKPYFAPYAGLLGQLLLGGYLAAYLGALWLLRRLTAHRRRPRLLGQPAC